MRFLCKIYTRACDNNDRTMICRVYFLVSSTSGHPSYQWSESGLSVPTSLIRKNLLQHEVLLSLLYCDIVVPKIWAYYWVLRCFQVQSNTKLPLNCLENKNERKIISTYIRRTRIATPHCKTDMISHTPPDNSMVQAMKTNLLS